MGFLWGTAEPKRSQNISIWEGFLAVLFINWSTGVVMTGYALWLGATPAALAVLGALPTVAQFAAPLALLFSGSRKRLTILLASGGRALFGLVLLLPLLPEDWRIPGLLLVAALSQFVIAPVNVLWTSWMADLVPERERGSYFGFRNAILGLVGTLGNLLAGAVIDQMGKPWGFLLVLGVGVVAGVSATLFLRLQLEPPAPIPKITPAEFRSPLKDGGFRGFLVFVAAFMGAVAVGSSFVFPLFLQYARMTFAEVGLWTVIAASAGLLVGPWWGRVADYIGHMRVLIYTSGIAAVVLPTLWLLGGPGRVGPIWLAAVCDPIAWGGLGTALTNIALQSAPAQRRNLYLAWYWVAFAVGGVLGATVGGTLGSLELGPSPYHLPIVASMALRAAAVGYLIRRFRRG
ncbi:major facilitator superfamily MFS_1 [Allomeiothermus silvanus DSM 9946]|uniref:Major facilitator superfamily MFS_1 n=1 Tax=Allomeiothermus silvanus (strain ATCC 700542 / DSM 9946 / NBRC 106475 / NCIMB 13440 / VI-R2) TaxID=526227 RepID=D7BGZ1_ALLS1|nr:MFS transporter [Allomeiothermus silvanus]ADH62145.1 major facilitator superfamily MFS_1 [Allomeiothermus silvanus DSM 9946]